MGSRKQNPGRFSEHEIRREIQQMDADAMEAIVAGCALVANADGWIAREERRRMNGLIRGLDPVAAFSGGDIEAVFKELTAHFARDHSEAERRALMLVRKLRGKHAESHRLITICQAIASADGGYDAEEREALVKLCGALNLNPVAFDLATS